VTPAATEQVVHRNLEAAGLAHRCACDRPNLIRDEHTNGLSIRCLKCGRSAALAKRPRPPRASERCPNVG